MGGLLCKYGCCRKAESGDALDSLTEEERRQLALVKPQPEAVVDDFFGVESTCYNRTNVALQCRLAFGKPQWEPDRVIPFNAVPSPYVKGLQAYLPTPEGSVVSSDAPTQLSGKEVIVGTVRMGFGHHRIAYSAATWALELGARPYLVDILTADCMEANLVRSMDSWYSWFSRTATQIGGPVEALWGQMMLQGTLNSLRASCTLAERIRPLMAGLPKDIPVIASHPLVGQIAVACGFRTVINLVIDNHPQYFLVVPGAMNFVQSPAYYEKLLDMHVPPSSLRYAGHWVSQGICANVASDCRARIARCQKTSLPRRFLISVGGAGAQKKFLIELIRSIIAQDLLKDRKVKLYINCGDHPHMYDAITELLTSCELRWRELTTSEESEALVSSESLQAISEPTDWNPVTLLRFDSHFAAFRCTDLLIRVVDVLITKPSELAFFPVPKLHIRRVGGHEGDSAIRSSEIGDGTAECRTVRSAFAKLEQLAAPVSPLFLQMNQAILIAQQAGTYEGSRVACEYALGMEDKSSHAPSTIGEETKNSNPPNLLGEDNNSSHAPHKGFSSA